MHFQSKHRQIRERKPTSKVETGTLNWPRAGTNKRPVYPLFANESDGYKTTSAPSAFRFSCGRNARTGLESTPEQSECHYRNRHQEDLSHRCRGRHRGSPASVLQSQAQETSSVADPATVFDRVNRFPSHPQIISDRLSPFANNVLPLALNLRGAAHIRK